MRAKPHRYTPEQTEYIRKIAKGRWNDEITEMFNKRFGTNLSVEAVRSHKLRNGIKSDVPNRKPDSYTGLFTKEQQEFIKNNVKGRSNKELAALVNKTFGLSITTRQINTYKKNHGLTSGLDGRFKKGHETWNKGMKGLQLGGEKGWFKKGQAPINHKPVGSERINVEGYTEVKVAEPSKWELKHRVVWEEENGPIPEGHVVLFGDGDKQNFDLDNLILVSRQQLVRLNQNNLIKNDVELTKTGIMIADLHIKVSERKKSLG